MRTIVLLLFFYVLQTFSWFVIASEDVVEQTEQSKTTTTETIFPTRYGMGYEQRMAILKKQSASSINSADISIKQIPKVYRPVRPQRPYRPQRPIRPGR